MSERDFDRRVERQIQAVKKATHLGSDAYKLRNSIAEAGKEVTPDELHEALAEARVRIGHGTCRFCGAEEEELRYGMCFSCFVKD